MEIQWPASLALSVLSAQPAIQEQIVRADGVNNRCLCRSQAHKVIKRDVPLAFQNKVLGQGWDIEPAGGMLRLPGTEHRSHQVGVRAGMQATHTAQQKHTSALGTSLPGRPSLKQPRQAMPASRTSSCVKDGKANIPRRCSKSIDTEVRVLPSSLQVAQS